MSIHPKTEEKNKTFLLIGFYQRGKMVPVQTEPYRDGVFGAGVDDGLQQVVKLCDV